MFAPAFRSTVRRASVAVALAAGALITLGLGACTPAERRQAIDLTDPAIQKQLETFVPLIQQGRGAEVLYIGEM
ncbi:MAG TPA: hypothetical protein ENN42_00645 [Thioalkalivibrio sp.]|nr:hypothetical protein [Thioalkalivibrio sp.]